ncbi:MAG: transposase [Rhodanobacteraceae bacterium]
MVQRGNDRQPCFFTEIEYIRYLQDLHEIARWEGCALHAYVLMTNHVHLLMTPGAAGRVGRTMQAMGRRYVRYVNDRYFCTGTLWEGRYKASLVGDDRHVLQCQRYIELNPLRARMVADAADYRWSSFRHHALGVPDPMVTPHPAMLGLGRTPHERRQNYRELVTQAVDPEEIDAIRRHLQHQHIYGPERFRQAVEAQLGRTVGPKKIGRPKTTVIDTDDLLESRL